MGLDTRINETYEDLKGSMQTGNLDQVVNDIIDARKNLTTQDYQKFLGKLNEKVDGILPGVTIIGTVDQCAGNGKPDLVIKDKISTSYLDSDEAFRLHLHGGGTYRFGDDAEMTFKSVQSALSSGDLHHVIEDVQRAKREKTPDEFQEYLRQLNEKVGTLLPGVKIVGTFDQGGRTDLAITDSTGGGFLSSNEGDRLRLSAKFKTSPEQVALATKTFTMVIEGLLTGDLSTVISDLQKAEQMYTPQQYQAYLSRLNDMIWVALPGATIAGTFEQPTGRIDLIVRDRHGTGYLSANEGNRLSFYINSSKH